MYDGRTVFGYNGLDMEISLETISYLCRAAQVVILHGLMRLGSARFVTMDSLANAYSSVQQVIGHVLTQTG